MAKKEDRVDIVHGAIINVGGHVVGRDMIDHGARRGINPDIPVPRLAVEFTNKIGEQLTSQIINKYGDIGLGQFYNKYDPEDLVRDLGVNEKTAEAILEAALQLISGN